jgi:hypothetical protein
VDCASHDEVSLNELLTAHAAEVPVAIDLEPAVRLRSRSLPHRCIAT